MSKETLEVLNRKREAIKAQLKSIKDFMNNPDEKDKTHLESKLDTLKSLRFKLSDIRNEYFEIVENDSDLEPLESEILDLEDDCKDIYISRFLQPKQTIPSCVELFETQRGEFVGHSKGHSTMLLSTALVYHQNSLGEACPLRALLDFGNQTNLIVHEATLAFGLKYENFYSPRRIDLPLSNQIFFELLNNGKIKLADGKLILQDTVFGYIASGVMLHNYTNNSYCGLVTNANELNNSIKCFWEIENYPDFEIPTMSTEKKLCEEHVTSTYNIDETGRFIVKMPLSKDLSCLGDSKQMALRRLNSLWRRLVQDPKILELYMGEVDSSDFNHKWCGYSRNVYNGL
ncbi:DUF1758 domain-containing protein [Trichonephila clavipes]|uniref:DUF1758 domain-containing protein n=1 Tax=Trichonephila clavipes TaxID=2585209 RepID=A0A8X6W6N4_TRICX|nr:DUF1758 domain-containing protein [Trichonephila clavipes]